MGHVHVNAVDDVRDRQRPKLPEPLRIAPLRRLDDDRALGVDRADRLGGPLRQVLPIGQVFARRRFHRLVGQIVAPDRLDVLVPPRHVLPDLDELPLAGGVGEQAVVRTGVAAAGHHLSPGRRVQIDDDPQAVLLAQRQGGVQLLQGRLQPAIVGCKIERVVELLPCGPVASGQGWRSTAGPTREAPSSSMAGLTIAPRSRGRLCPL